MAHPVLVRAVRAVLGDVDPARLGITYAHEHLIVDGPVIVERFPEIHLPSVDEAVAELAGCVAAGLGAMVDAMPDGAGRDLVRLTQVSRRSGVHIVASTGAHLAQYHPGPDPVAEPGVAERFISEIADGRCGVIKVASGPDGMDGRARRLFEAAAEAHRHTGAPILTHCEAGLGGLAQLGFLAALGVAPQRVTLSHTDKVTDPGYHRDLLGTGANLEYDQALRHAGSETNPTEALLVAMLQEGFERQLMLGTDGARRSLWSTLGGSPGLAWLLTDFAVGLESEVHRRLLVDNPARWLTFGSTPGPGTV